MCPIITIWREYAALNRASAYSRISTSVQDRQRFFILGRSYTTLTSINEGNIKLLNISYIPENENHLSGKIPLSPKSNASI